MKISGNQLIVKALIAEHVELLFAYPGSAVIELFDELYNQKKIRLILPRHEQGLVHAADGYARATGKVGVCLVTSGPGATNTVTAIATAHSDSVPLVCLCGQVKRDLIGNDAFQEVDIVGITRSITKHSVLVTEREDLGRIIKEAFYIATSGKPGPVVIDLPADLLAELGSDCYPQDVAIRSYRPHTEVHIGQIKRAVKLLQEAKQPLFLAGGGLHVADCQQAFTELVEMTGIPVVSTIMGRGAIATTHPLFIGNLGMHGSFAANQAVMACDLLCSIGTRFNDRITGEVGSFAPAAKLIHIDIDSAAISRRIKVDVPIVADAGKAIEAICDYYPKKDLMSNEWLERLSSWQNRHPLLPKMAKAMAPSRIIGKLNDYFPEGIIVTDVGQHQMWTTQFLALAGSKQLITSGGQGTMGYGLPAAIGAQLGKPEQQVICVTGDGGMQMNSQELMTAVMEDVPLIVLILNNGYLGMVRQWQELKYNKHYAGTNLSTGNFGQHVAPDYLPDFVMLAESYGAKGVRVSSEEELSGAFELAIKEKQRPTVIDCLIDAAHLVLPMVTGALNEMILEVEE